MQRARRLEEILAYYDSSPLEVKWRKGYEDKARVIALQTFVVEPQHCEPSADPRNPEYYYFDSGQARRLEAEGKLSIVSARCDTGEVSWKGQTVAAYRVWPEALPDLELVQPEWRGIFVIARLMKFIQVLPNLLIYPGEVFAIQWAAIRYLHFNVEGSGDHGGALLILQP